MNKMDVQGQRFRKAFASIGIGCVVLFGSANLSAAQLFSAPSTSASNLQESALSAEVARTRQVLVDTSLFSAADSPESGDEAPTVVDMELFDGTSVSATLFPAVAGMAGMQGWTGKLVDDQGSQVTIVVNGDIVQSTISSAKYGEYQIRYLENVGGEALHDLREIDSEGFPSDHPPEFADVEASAGSSHNFAGDGSTGDASDQIDIMVVYTPAARSAVGGTSAMQTLIGLATTATNNSYSNSNINTMLNVVHTAEVSYTESGSFSTDLNRLIATADGFMDNVHSLRNTHAADMVGLLTNSTSFCGLASSILANEANAFHVTYHGCAVGNMSYAHEFGHLQGARHNWLSDSGTTPYIYGHGYNPGGGWRTVMSYTSGCATSCPRIQHWSNPNVNYSGAPAGPTGIAGGSTPSENYRVLNNTAYTVANFRDGQAAPAIVSPAPSSELGSPSQAFTWSADSTISGYYLYVGTSFGAANLYNSGFLAGTTTSHTATGLPMDGSTVYVRLWYREGIWKNVNYTYTAAEPITPMLLAPASGATLAASEPFVWTSEGLNVERWYLYLGSSAYGATDVYNSGLISGNVYNHFVTPLASPTGEIYMRLWYRVGGNWDYVQDLFYTDIANPGFYEPFNSISAWTEDNGDWFSQSGRARITDSGAPNSARSALSRTGQSFTDVDYRARIYKAGTAGNPVALSIRSSDGVDSNGYCNDCYIFQYTLSGLTSVWKRVDGVWGNVSNWTSANSSAINSGWNEVRVVMIGNRYWWIMNNQLVATGTDNSHSAGLVGVEGYKNGEMYLWVDYAWLDVPNADMIDLLDQVPLAATGGGADGTGDVSLTVDGE